MSSKGDPRRRPAGWELRAAVTEGAFTFLDDQARELGRSRTWHVGLAVEAFAVVAQALSPAERARLDELFRRPEEFAELLRPVLR